MRAKIGDRLCVHGRTVGRADQRVDIVEVRGADGGPPYLVRHPDGHESVLFPGPDTVVESASDPAGSPAAGGGTQQATGAGLGQGRPTSFEPEEDAPSPER